MLNEDKLREALENWARSFMRGALCVDGVIKETDVEQFTCTVQVDEITFYNVPIETMIGSRAAVIGIPAVESDCLLIFRNNKPTQPQIIKVDQYSKIMINTPLVEFNEGKLGGMVKAKELKTQSEKDKAIIDALLTVINGSPIAEPGNGAPSALQTALKSALAGKQSGTWTNLENAAIKQ